MPSSWTPGCKQTCHRTQAPYNCDLTPESSPCFRWSTAWKCLRWVTNCTTLDGTCAVAATGIQPRGVTSWCCPLLAATASTSSTLVRISNHPVCTRYHLDRGGDCPPARVRSRVVQSVKITWWTHELLRWERHYCHYWNTTTLINKVVCSPETSGFVNSAVLCNTLEDQNPQHQPCGNPPSCSEVCSC